MRLFISYVQNDYSTALTIVDILRYSGHEPMFDHRLLQGSDWQTASSSAIRQCDVFVILLSPRSVESEWCLWECCEALDLEKPVVPVLLQPCDIPSMLQEIQYTDFSGGDVLIAVAQLLGGLHYGFLTMTEGQCDLDEQPDRTAEVRRPETRSSFEPAVDARTDRDAAQERGPAAGIGPSAGPAPAVHDFETSEPDSLLEIGKDIVPETDPYPDLAAIFPSDQPIERAELPHNEPIAPPPTLPEADLVGEPDSSTFPYEPETVLIPAGPFVMGSDLAEDILAAETETPQHEVTLPGFRIGKYPVAVGEYWAFMDEGGYFEQRYWTDAGWAWRVQEHISQPRFWDDEKWTGNDHWPVVGVSWYEAVAYTQWLAEITDRLYRLPTESEWEKAARGTDGRLYPWGNEWRVGLSNVAGGMWRTTAVGYYSPDGDSPYGVADMSGNVWEWCLTKWRDRYTDPEDNGFSGSAARCLRGGSWFGQPQDARVTARIRDEPSDWDDHLGFRVACGAPPFQRK
jgi:formylglycine-generating enzyme required for sulfatase activity